MEMYPLTSTWNKYEDKAFEIMLAASSDFFYQDPLRCFSIIAAELRKSPEDVHVHYQQLVRDVEAIFSGPVGIPEREDHVEDREVVYSLEKDFFDPSLLPERKTENQKKRGNPWTVEEHR